MRHLALRAVLVATGAALSAQDLHLPLDEPSDAWHAVERIADGARGHAARFGAAGAHIDAGRWPVSSREPFTLRCYVRTRDAGFSTLLMARRGDDVGISLVLGREPGRVSFEAWSWRTVKLVSRSRLDDGRWHAIEVAYDAVRNTALLRIDDAVEASAELGDGGSPDAELRLGDNIGALQPFRGDLDEVVLTREPAHADLFAVLAPVVAAAEKSAALRALRDALLQRSTPSLAESAAAGWPERRRIVREHAAGSLGLWPSPARGPLDVRVHGELRRDGVRVQRVSWEGFPGQRATGWLWLPDPRPPGRAPAILCPHGHWQHGARHPVVQARCAAFARFGWLALAVDSVHVEDVASGVSSIGAMTWHNQRALDLLLARDDVDPARVASTGASGGGQQTYYLMALEDRLAAAAPMVMACYFAEIVDDLDAHCGCNHAPRIAAGTDVPELCAVFAPRPAMFGSVGGDWTRSFPREGLPELAAHWRRLGAAMPVRHRFADEGHNYDRPMREEVYGFLHDALLGPGADGAERRAVAEPEFAPYTLAELAPLDAACPSAPPDERALAAEHRARRAKVHDLRSLAPNLPWRIDAAPIEWRGAADASWRPATVRGADGVPVPLMVRNTAAADPEPWTVVASERGMADAVLAREPWLAAPRRLVLTDPRWFGEWRRFQATWRRNGILLGCGEGYQAAHDLALVCASLPGTAPVRVVGIGEAGVAALLATRLCDRIVDVVADDIGPAYADAGNRTPQCPELILLGDRLDLLRRDGAALTFALGGAALGPSDDPRRVLGQPMSPQQLAARIAGPPR